MKSENWKPRKLDELGFVGRGKSRHRPRNAPELYGGPYPFIQTADIMASEMYISSYSKTYSELGLAQSKMWKKGTLCMTIAGENTAETAILGIDACFPDSVVAFIPNPELSDVRFVKYYLDTMKASFKSVSRGATQDNLSLDKLLSFDLLVPDVIEQRKIADVLSAYDDLIEVNARRIRVLEAMAQSVYREWFGNVDAKSLPRGWEMKKLIDACDIVMGQSPASEFYNEDGNGLPFHQGVTDFGDRFPTDRVFCTVENRIAEKGDVLFSVRAPVGRINIATKKIVIGRGVSAIRSKTGNQMFVFQQLKEQFQEVDMMGGGTIYKSVTKEDMHGIKFLLPKKDMIDKFEEFADPIFQELEILTMKNGNLRRTRDLLLPRLVSGEVVIG